MIETTVYRKGVQRFNMVGQSLPRQLFETSEGISQGLAKRLANYALERMVEEGFNCVRGWKVEVSTIDAEYKPSHRSYYVRFINPKGGAIGVEGILTRNGWPSLDHGLFICDSEGR